MARFSDQALRRYSRQILLREVGGRGQERIAGSRLDLIVAPGGGGIASVAAQYLLRAGVAEVRYFAEHAATAEPLLALAAAEGLAAPQSDPALVASSEGRLTRGQWPSRPELAQALRGNVRCVAAWRLAGESLPAWWVRGDRCSRRCPEAAAAMAQTAGETAGDAGGEAGGDSLDPAALRLGSALALGLLQELLGYAPAAGAFATAPA